MEPCVVSNIWHRELLMKIYKSMFCELKRKFSELDRHNQRYGKPNETCNWEDMVKLVESIEQSEKKLTKLDNLITYGTWRSAGTAEITY